MKRQECERLTLFQEDFPASRLVLPGSEEARRMTVISGRKCLELFASCGPVGLLERMLLESSEWHSTMFCFRWKMKDTPLGHSLFQLMPLGRSTRGIESLFWPTPVAMDGQMKANRERIQLLLKGETTFVSKKSGIRASIQGINNWICARIAKKNGQIKIGYASPEFVEWLMGYPNSWTDLNASETP